MRILVVDDSKAMRMIVIRTLRQAGYGDHTYEEAVNGAEALTAIQASAPDLVLSDWNMPEMNGIELLEALNTAGIKLPFGFITSEGTDAIKTQAADAGARFLITKPFNVDKFQAVMEAVMG